MIRLAYFLKAYEGKDPLKEKFKHFGMLNDYLIYFM